MILLLIDQFQLEVMNDLDHYNISSILSLQVSCCFQKIVYIFLYLYKINYIYFLLFIIIIIIKILITRFHKEI